MIKKYNQYIKEQIDHMELDPYGEEDWDDTTSYFQKGDNLLAKKSKFNKKKIEKIVNGNIYWIPNLLRFDGITYYRISEKGKLTTLAVVKGTEMKEYFDKIPHRFNLH